MNHIITNTGINSRCSLLDLSLKSSKKTYKKSSGIYLFDSEPVTEHLYFSDFASDTSNGKTAELSNENTDDSKSCKKIRTLHIEDDDEIRFLVRAFLKKHADVDSAIDAFQAISHTADNHYDLIIADINLGEGMNGIDAIREIKTRMNYEHIPVIAATAYGTSDIRTQCIEAGMDAFLLKPFMKKDLISTIEKVMEQQR